MKLAPIVSFVYNRPEHTKRTVEALSKNKLAKYSEYTIFADGAKKPEHQQGVDEVRKIVSKVKGFKKVNLVFRKENWGLTKSIIGGISDVVNRYGVVISVEDDIVTSPYFLNYINDGLVKYKDNKKVFTISAYNLPYKIMKFPKDYNEDVYFIPRVSPWGWGTWKDRWENIDWDVKDYNEFIADREQVKRFNMAGNDRTAMLKAVKSGKLDTWDIQWDYAIFKADAVSVYPVRSFVDNIGLDGSGVHTGPNSKLRNVQLNMKEKIEFTDDVKVNPVLLKNFKKCHEPGIFSMIARLTLKYSKKLLKKR